MIVLNNEMFALQSRLPPHPKGWLPGAGSHLDWTQPTHADAGLALPHKQYLNIFLFLENTKY